jgi:tetratricopeptide (TPR) repeat protein
MEKLQREIDEAFKAGDFERVVDKGIELFTEDPSTDLGLRIAFAYRERWEFQKGLDMLHTVMSKLAKGESERTKDFEFLGNIALDYARIHLASYESGDRDSRGEIDDALMNLTTAVHLARELGKKDSSLLVHALSYRARCYLHLGDRDGLRRDLKDVQASGVKDGFLLFHQGETLYMLGKTTLDRGLKKTYYGQAVSRLDKAGRQLDSRKDALLAQQVYSRLGLVYYELGDRSNLNASNASFKKAAKAGLETPALYMSWGRTFVKLDKKREAAQKFRESYKLEPSIDACHEAAYWFYTSKVRQSAIEILDQGLARFPKSQKLRDLKQIVSRDD